MGRVNSWLDVARERSSALGFTARSVACPLGAGTFAPSVVAGDDRHVPVVMPCSRKAWPFELWAKLTSRIIA